MRRPHPPLLVLLSLGLLLLPSAATLAEEPAIDFTADIRPILSDRCFACHGPDEAQRQGGLRLDLRDSATAEADSGAMAIVPGDAAASELVRRITSQEEFERMPPAETNKPLTADEIDRLRRWVEQGAAYEQHWSFVPPTRPALPDVKQAGWPRGEIDTFILARLEAARLAPSPQADKATLLRRVTLDLTGLPATPAEVDAFLADESPDAYERAVDRLLASPRYGEHMARFWLDAARYGDTHGLHLDNYREMWPYRDWVVRAFNTNKPYDEFITEQLAGDLLAQPTVDQLVASGFNRCHVTTSEGGSIAEEVYVRNVVDRVVTFGTVMLGLTFDCTRCHDHKYDPLTQTDFYSLFAYFNSLDSNPLDGNARDHAPVVAVPSRRQQARVAELCEQIASLEASTAAPSAAYDEQQAAWERQLAAEHGPREVAAVDAAVAESEVADDAATPADAAALRLGEWYLAGPFTITRARLGGNTGPEGKPADLAQQFDVASGKLAWQRRHYWRDGEVHHDLPGRFSVSYLYRTITAPTAMTVEATFGGNDALRVTLNEKQVLSNEEMQSAADARQQVKLKLAAGENRLMVKVASFAGRTSFYFDLPGVATAPPADIVDMALLAEEQRSAEQQQRLRTYYRLQTSSAEELQQLRTKLTELQAELCDVERAIPTTLISREAAEPKPAHRLNRGEYDQPLEEVARATPGVLPPMSDRLPRNRLGLAQWLLAPEHPLTARVAVNRFWQQVFGTGLVKTSEDFGSQGEPPSHPLLLDWLAVEFTESGWDVKHLMKRLVMSATYQQASRVTPELRQRDPANRLLARGPRYRLDAEVLRDQALVASGLLVERMGGPSVKPPQPGGLWEAVGYSGSNTVKFVADRGHAKVHRRTLYTFIKRTAPPPQMSTLDAPSREACTVRRERTNTPLQALMMLNDPQFFEAAVALAERTMLEAPDDDRARAEFLLRQCVGRPAESWELDALVRQYQGHRAEYQADGSAAQQLVAGYHRVGGKQSAQLDKSQWAAWSLVANLVLNLDEVVTKN